MSVLVMAERDEADRSGPLSGDGILVRTARTAPVRPKELDDAVWLARAYRDFGDRLIADELQVTRSVVRAARKRLGIESKPSGRRGVRADDTPLMRLESSATLRLVEERAALWRKHKAPPSEAMLVAAIRAIHEAKLRGEQRVYADGLLDIATAAVRLFDHLREVGELG